jgi:N-acetylmuramoyl-L-alanine amidase
MLFMFDSNLHIKLFNGIISLLFLILFMIPYNGITQNTEVVAEKGEGIYRLLTRNGLSATEYMEPFIELNKSKLGRNNSLIEGRKYTLPGGIGTVESKSLGTGKIMHYDIFGEKYADVEITSDKLKGAVYYLVSGHGGPDPGAMGKYSNHSICEDEYAYDVTLRLARKLISEGAKVYMITTDKNDGIRDDAYLAPDKDEVCYPNLTMPLNQTRRLRQRTDAVNKLYNENRGSFQRMIAIHVDSRSEGENIDVFFYHDKRSKTGERAARKLQKTFQQKYNEHQPGRGYNGTVSDRGLYVIRNTYPPVVYIELGNVNHQRDIQRIIIPDNRQALANWLNEGLIADFNINK